MSNTKTRGKLEPHADFIFEKMAQGLSYGAIADLLAERGVKTARNNIYTWSLNRLKKIEIRRQLLSPLLPLAPIQTYQPLPTAQAPVPASVRPAPAPQPPAPIAPAQPIHHTGPVAVTQPGTPVPVVITDPAERAAKFAELTQMAERGNRAPSLAEIAAAKRAKRNAAKPVSTQPAPTTSPL